MTDTSVAEAGLTKARLSPRKRRRIIRGVQYVLFLGAVLAVALAADWGPVGEHFVDLKVAKEAFPEIITVALTNTVIYTLSGYVVGFFLGLVIAMMRLSEAAPIRVFALLYIEIFRGLPLLIIFLIIGLGIPVAFPDFDFPFGDYGIVAISLGLPAAAYMAESFRAGIQAIPKGQMEAARSLGMPYLRAMISIVLPQAIRVVIPPLTNELIMLFKDSSLVFAIGVSGAFAELTKFGRDLATEHADSTPLILAGFTYLLITVPASVLVRRMENKQQKGRR